MMTAGITQFWVWFEENSNRFLYAPASVIVDEVTKALGRVEFGVGVEIFSPAQFGNRELIITSHGNSAKFGIVKRIVRQSPRIDLWTFSALKPPRGFNFLVKHKGPLSISEWRFVPLKASQEFKEIAIRIEMPESDLALMDESVLNQVIEQGVGEVLYSLCDHVEMAATQTSDAMPIGMLAEILHSWAITRGPDSIQEFLPELES